MKEVEEILQSMNLSYVINVNSIKIFEIATTRNPLNGEPLTSSIHTEFEFLQQSARVVDILVSGNSVVINKVEYFSNSQYHGVTIDFFPYKKYLR